METIFIGIPAYNEEDIHLTIQSALNKAQDPELVHIGVVLHYPKKDFPDVTMYPNVKVIAIDSPIGLGTGPTRDLAASLYDNETYFLQIDAHTIFRPMWDVILKANYKELNKTVEKPIISGYIPYWFRDKVTGQPLTMNHDVNFDKAYPGWMLVSKDDPRWRDRDEENFRHWAYGMEGVNSPAAFPPDFSKSNYVEQYLTAGHFIFTSGKYLEEIPYDPLITYHEENTTPLRAWTRGYRIFCMKDHAIWTREMMSNGRDVPNSWRSTYDVPLDPEKKPFVEMVVDGTLRNKDILTGKITGIWGAPTVELLREYEKASGIDYQKFYEEMYKVVEETGNKYNAGRKLYDLEKKRETA